MKAKDLLQHSSLKIKGMCTDLNVSITEEDITQARRETWEIC